MSPPIPCSNCLRLLKRSILQVELSAQSTKSQRSTFSSSSRLPAAAKAKKPVAAASRRKALVLSKNVRAAGGKPPAVGERKANKKKVVLSNVNALDIQDMEKLSKQTMGYRKLSNLRNQVLAFDEATVERLRVLESFKHTQGWNMFRRPATLVRKETAQLAAAIEFIDSDCTLALSASGKARISNAQDKSQQKQSDQFKMARSVLPNWLHLEVPSSASKSTARTVVFGEKDSGKSVLQMQAQALALLRGWIVVHIPEGQDLALGHTAYEPVTHEGKTIYVQPQVTAKLLGNIATANSAVLSALRLSRQHTLPVQLQPKSSLIDLIRIGARDPELAWPVWQALWSELLTPSGNAAQGLQRPKILFTMDSMNHLMRDTKYLDADAKPVHGHDLALTRHFFNALAGKEGLVNGGMIFAAASASNPPSTPTFDRCLAEKTNKNQDSRFRRMWDPYTSHDLRVQETMQLPGVLKLEGLSKDEARGIMVYYARSGLLRSSVTDNLVSEKWTMAGGGIIGQVEKAAVRVRF